MPNIYKKKKNPDGTTTDTTTTSITTTDTTNQGITNKTNYSIPNNENGIENTEDYKLLHNSYLTAQSNLQQQNQLAHKYAQTTAQAQGFATQGAMQQLNNDLMNAYLNRSSSEQQNYANNLVNLKNNNSTTALQTFQDTLNAMVNKGNYVGREEDVQNLINTYMAQMNATDRNTAQTLLNNYEETTGEQAPATLSDFGGGELYLDGKNIDVSVLKNIDLSKKQVEEIFGEDIADQNFMLGLGAIGRELGYFARTLATNPQSLNGKVFNMNGGNGKAKYYYVENGKLYRISKPSGHTVINLDDWYSKNYVAK